MSGIPEYAVPVWVDGKLTNCGDVPLWSGKGAPPAIGAYIDIAGPMNEVATVIEYRVEGHWLMIWAERHSDGKRGDLAGAEIRYGE